VVIIERAGVFDAETRAELIDRLGSLRTSRPKFPLYPRL
jgi:hypothetical protein